MTTPRRKWTLAATLLFGLAAAVWWFGRGGGTMEVKLIFVGYTNYDEDTPALALVLATNSGSVTVALYAKSLQAIHMTNDAFPETLGQFVSLSPLNLPCLLEPGESVRMVTEPPWPLMAWFTEIRVQRHGLRDRLYHKLHDRCGPRTMGIVDKILSPPAAEVVKLGPITNRPPTNRPP